MEYFLLLKSEKKKKKDTLFKEDLRTMAQVGNIEII